MIVLEQSSSLRPLPISYSWHGWCLPFTPSPGGPLMSLFPGLDGSLIKCFLSFFVSSLDTCMNSKMHTSVSRGGERDEDWTVHACYSDSAHPCLITCSANNGTRILVNMGKTWWIFPQLLTQAQWQGLKPLSVFTERSFSAFGFLRSAGVSLKWC